MALFKTTCPDCGEVAVRDYELQMTSAAADGSAAYRFCCPDCCQIIERSASSRVVALLAQGGVPQLAFRTTGQRPALTREDLLSFHELLRDDVALASFLAQDTDDDRPTELPVAEPQPGWDASRSSLRARRWWSRRNA